MLKPLVGSLFNGGTITPMFEAPAQAFRVSAPGVFEALAPLPPDPESDRPLLLDWCASQGHTLLNSPPLFPVVREAAASPDLRLDLLLLTETGTLVAVLVDADPPPSHSPVLGAAVAAAHWCSTLRYDDLEELFNSDRSEPQSLQEAHREHFGNSPGIPSLPSELNRSHVVLLILPRETCPDLGPLLRFLSARSLPVVCLKYACFRSEADTLLVVSRQGEGPAASFGSPLPPEIDSTTVGDLAGAVSALDPDESPEHEPALQSLARRKPRNSQP